MARQPMPTEAIIEAFGPHLAFSCGVRLDRGVEADRMVKTHCCFCGQQCGIQLKVKDNEVIGFEPWEEFPFNRGMLCPKGVKRYLQGSHPDRLVRAFRREPSAPNGFLPLAYEEAIRGSLHPASLITLFIGDLFGALDPKVEYWGPSSAKGGGGASSRAPVLRR